MTTSSLTWVTPAGSIGVFLENTTISKQFEATPGGVLNTVTYTLLNGSLPAGSVTLTSLGYLSGQLGAVYEDTTTVFTIRATEMNGSNVVTVNDRTFSIKVTGATAPYFTTPAGQLFSTNDSVWQSYQVVYVNPDPTTSTTISLVNGSLPPGLEINSNGLIRGYANIPSTASATYTFSLQATSQSGSSTPVQYSITVINQASLPGFVGRNPTLLNTQPRTFNTSSDQYSAYYLSSNSLGEFVQDNNFIFKFIGYDFDAPTSTSTLTYDINGLESIGVHNNALTGWQVGTLLTVGATIQTYNITARVYKTAMPTLTSDSYLLSITVIGDIDSKINWVTVSNLGTITNGAISQKSVAATNPSGVELQYRLASSTIQSNLRTVVNTGATNNAFGQLGAHATGTGNTWSNQPSLSSTVSSYSFNTSLYDSGTSSVILGGQDQNNTAIIGVLTDNSLLNISPVATSYPINDVIFANSLYVAIGNSGSIVTTTDTASWADQQNSTVTVNLNSVCWGNSKYVAVGDVGTIITSTDGITWTQRISGVTQDLTGITYTNTTFVAVGSLGTLLTSADGITWSKFNTQSDINYTAVASNLDTSNVTVIVGHGGTLLKSTDHGVTWTTISNKVTTTTLYGVIYTGGNFLAVGDAGTVLVYNVSGNFVYSPTLDQLPVNLHLTSAGNIIGRLAFESTNEVVSAGTSRSYNFLIQAYSPTIPDIVSTKQFTLTTYQEFNQPYDNLYIQCYPNAVGRELIASLLHNDTYIPTADLYRTDDPYFGKAQSVIYQHMFGVPSISAALFYDVYTAAIIKNFYWRDITLGQLKTAVARDANNDIIYEVVYSEVIDNLVNPQGVSIPKEIVWPRAIKIDNSNWWTSTTDLFTSDNHIDQVNTASSSELSRELYPNSLENMRQQIADTVGFLNNSSILPSWMTSQQVDGNVIGYKQAWVLCYTKPGKSAQIKANIETEWMHTVNQIDFQIDKFEVDRSMTYNYQGGTSWATLPSAQPFPSPTNSQDKYVYIPQKTILPGV